MNSKISLAAPISMVASVMGFGERFGDSVIVFGVGLS
jgi:hypothetical protein